MKLLKLCDKHIFFPLLWKHLDIKQQQQERFSPHQHLLKRRRKGSERTSRDSGVRVNHDESGNRKWSTERLDTHTDACLGFGHG